MSRRQMRGVIATTLVTGMILFAGNSLAQNVPAECEEPNSIECQAKVPTAWKFYQICGSWPAVTSEGLASENTWQNNNNDGDCTPNTKEGQHWADGDVLGSDFNYPCAPPDPGTFPDTQAGVDIENYSLYTRTRYSNNPSCSSTTDIVALSRADRALACRDGYVSANSGYCKRSDSDPDLGKNLGNTCKTSGQCSAGNPINIGTGNKFQRETDFVGAGPNPLRFSRFYNSYAGISDASNETYRFGIGGGDAAHSGLNPDEQAAVRAIAIGSIGMNWRHTYSRSVFESETDDLRSAAIYREDGQVLIFNEHTTGWIADADVNFTLTELTSGGQTTGWEIGTPSDGLETYSADGQLLTIANRAGVTVTLSYDSSERLEKATDEFGRELLFDYVADPQPGEEWWEETDLTVRIDTVTDPLGNVYDYDSSGRLAKAIYPDLTEREYKYQDSSFPYALTAIIDENGDQFATFEYDALGRADVSYHGTSADIAERVDIDFTPTNTPYYDVHDASITFGSGSSEQYTRTAEVEVKFGVAKMGDEVQGTDTEERTYDSQGNVERYTDYDGTVTYRVYNSRNLETSRTEAEGVVGVERTISTTWDSTYRLRDVVTEPERTIDYDYETNGDLKKVTITSTSTSGEDPSTDGNYTRIWNYTYNSYGQVTSIDGPRVDSGIDDITTLNYYEPAECVTELGKCGQLEYVTDAEGNRTDYDEYYDDGRLKKMTDANGLTTEYEYDTRRRLTKITVSDGTTDRVTDYDYDDAGQLDLVTMPNGLELDYEWTTAHLLDYVEDNAGNKIDYDYDAHGRKIDEDLKDSGGTLKHDIDTVYDDFGFIDTLTAGGSTTEFDYDPAGNLESQTDPNLNDTIYTVDEIGRVSQIEDALTNDTDFDFDDQDNLIQVIAPNGATTDYEYDGLGNLDNEDSADRGLTDYDYDDAGNLRFRDDARGVEVETQYDQLNRPTNVIYDNSPSLDVTFSYDSAVAGDFANGRLNKMEDETGSTTYTYTKFGEIFEETHSIDALGDDPEEFIVEYEYNDAGDIDVITMPDGRIIDYGFDSQGRVNKIETTFDGVTKTLIDTVEYMPFGPMTSWHYVDDNPMDPGLTQTITYDQQYMPSGMTIGSFFDVTYGLDSGGVNIDTITDNKSGLPDWNQTFDYDVLNRLTDDDRTDPNNVNVIREYDYDDNGNRLWVKDGGGTKIQDNSYDTDSNRLNSRDQVLSVVLDAAGNTTDSGDGTHTFEYDDRGRMIKGKVNGTLKEEYKYNGLGQRIVKVVNPGLSNEVSHAYIYGQDGELLLDSKFSSSGIRADYTHIWLNGVPVAFVKTRYSSSGNLWSETLTYIHPDYLGTPRVGTRPDDQVVSWRWQSGAFGRGTVEADPDGDGKGVYLQLRYPGQYQDSATDVRYNYFRTYDQTLGRYLKSDPIGLTGGLNSYAYVSSNPLHKIDPEGLKARVCCRNVPMAFGIDHCFIEFGDFGEKTVGLVGGKSSGQQWHTGRVIYNNGFDDSKHGSAKCGPWVGGDNVCSQVDSCVTSQADGYSNPSEYRWRGPNSNTFAGGIARSCGLEKPAGVVTPGWNDTPATLRKGLSSEPPVGALL